MAKKKKKNRKSKAQKKLERARNFIKFLKENPDMDHDFEEFAIKFMESSGITVSKLDRNDAEAKEKFDKYFEVAVLAWELSQKIQTYEQALLGLTLKPFDKFGLAGRTSLKMMLVRAFRVIFSLPADDQNVIHASMTILTPEEQLCLKNNVDLEYLE